MARTRQVRRIDKYHNFWPKKWSQIPHQENTNLVCYLRKMLIYFPKSLRMIKPMSILINNQISPAITKYTPTKNWYKRLSKQIFRKYKKDMFRYLTLDSHVKNSLYNLKLKSIRTLDMNILNYGMINHRCLKNLVTQNTNVQVFRAYGYNKCPKALIKTFKHMSSLKSLEIDMGLLITDFTNLLSDMKRKKKLERISITAKVSSVTSHQDERNQFSQALDRFLAQSNLKQFKFDGYFKDTFDINDVPFSIFHKKGISYDIRAFHSTDNIMFSKENAIALQSLDFLGINLKKEWISNYLEWGVGQEEHLKIQTASKALLFVTIFPTSQVDLSGVFQACSNVTTLDLILGTTEKDVINFSGLLKLSNLRNLVVAIEDINEEHESLFANLTLTAQKYQTLTQLVFKFSCPIDLKSCSNTILSFFQACTNTVTKVILQFGYTSGKGQKELEYMYQCFKTLLKLKSLTVYIDEMRSMSSHFSKFAEIHSALLEEILEKQLLLNELKLLLPHGEFPDFKLNLAKAKNLKKIHLDLRNTQFSSQIMESFSESLGIQSLELSLGATFTYANWELILKKVTSIKTLEIFKLNFASDDSVSDQIKDDADTMMKINSRMKFIAVQNYRYPAVLIFSRQQYYEDISSFFSGDVSNLSDSKQSRIYTY